MALIVLGAKLGLHASFERSRVKMLVAEAAFSVGDYGASAEWVAEVLKSWPQSSSSSSTPPTHTHTDHDGLFLLLPFETHNNNTESIEATAKRNFRAHACELALKLIACEEWSDLQARILLCGVALAQTEGSNMGPLLNWWELLNIEVQNRQAFALMNETAKHKSGISRTQQHKVRESKPDTVTAEQVPNLYCPPTEFQLGFFAGDGLAPTWQKAQHMLKDVEACIRVLNKPTGHEDVHPNAKELLLHAALYHRGALFNRKRTLLQLSQDVSYNELDRCLIGLSRIHLRPIVRGRQVGDVDPRAAGQSALSNDLSKLSMAELGNDVQNIQIAIAYLLSIADIEQVVKLLDQALEKSHKTAVKTSANVATYIYAVDAYVLQESKLGSALDTTTYCRSIADLGSVVKKRHHGSLDVRRSVLSSAQSRVSFLTSHFLAIKPVTMTFFFLQ
jgi:hypothetical protein